MLRFQSYNSDHLLIENRQIPWVKHPKIGWWQDRDLLTLYHGTHKNNLESILREGLTRPDPKTGMISLTLDPNTAFGYASMHGGEYNFRGAGQKAKHTPPKDRVVLVVRASNKWLMRNFDYKLSGNLPSEKERLTKKDLYDDTTQPDSQYYSLTEFRIKKGIPARSISGYMFKVSQ